MMIRASAVAFALLLAGGERAMSQERKTYPAPELTGGVGWLNTDTPIRLAELRGKCVLLDFWTYC